MPKRLTIRPVPLALCPLVYPHQYVKVPWFPEAEQKLEQVKPRARKVRGNRLAPEAVVQIYQLAADGVSNYQIAKTLGVTNYMVGQILSRERVGR